MKHGGDIQSYFDDYGTYPLDFSANISPLGIPTAIEDCIRNSISTVSSYPDPHSRRLTQALSEFHNLDSSYFLCGNGAADLIYRLSFALKPKKALLLAPTFGEYEESLTCVGCEISYYFLQASKNFLLEDEFLGYLKPDIDICFLCQPNNPTGQLCNPLLLEKIRAMTKEMGITLVIDECFLDFSLDAENYTSLPVLSRYPNIFILKAFTKMYAIPGIRLGYGVSSNKDLLMQLDAVGQPWSVSTLAEEVGIIALKQTTYVEEVLKLVQIEREKLFISLQCKGFVCYPSSVNFLLFYYKDENIKSHFAENGILIRDCSNYKGLSSGFYRIAVKNAEENNRFITILKNINCV